MIYCVCVVFSATVLVTLVYNGEKKPYMSIVSCTYCSFLYVKVYILIIKLLRKRD